VWSRRSTPRPTSGATCARVGGAEGIVAGRGSANDYLGSWIYDLWFLERLAGELGAPALPAVGVDEEWEIPYGMDEWAPKPWGR
jgi:hypothetical protein